MLRIASLALSAGIALTIPLRSVSPQDSTRRAPPRALIELSVSPAGGATFLGSLNITDDLYLYGGSHYGSAGENWRGFSIDAGVSFITRFHSKVASYIRLGVRRQGAALAPAEPVEWRTRFMTDFGFYARTGVIRPMLGFPVTWGKPWPEALDIVVGVAVGIPRP